MHSKDREKSLCTFPAFSERSRRPLSGCPKTQNLNGPTVFEHASAVLCSNLRICSHFKPAENLPGPALLAPGLVSLLGFYDVGSWWL
jgi:hypothetical protein